MISNLTLETRIPGDPPSIIHTELADLVDIKARPAEEELRAHALICELHRTKLGLELLPLDDRIRARDWFLDEIDRAPARPTPRLLIDLYRRAIAHAVGPDHPNAGPDFLFPET